MWRWGLAVVAQGSLELLDSSDTPASASQKAGITGVNDYAQTRVLFSNIPLTPLPGACGRAMS